MPARQSEVEGSNHPKWLAFLLLLSSSTFLCKVSGILNHVLHKSFTSDVKVKMNSRGKEKFAKQPNLVHIFRSVQLSYTNFEHEANY